MKGAAVNQSTAAPVDLALPSLAVPRLAAPRPAVPGRATPRHAVQEQYYTFP